MQTLWVALKEACRPPLELGTDEYTSYGSFSVGVNARHRLSLMSWKSVIGRLLGGAETASDVKARSAGA